MSRIMKKVKLKIMVASTIYGFEDSLEQICAVLQSFGYKVWNSHIRTIPVHPGLSNRDNCLVAVESCDIFFGIIRERYGAVITDNVSITHQEIRKAIELRKPRWFVTHRNVTVARQLLKQYMYNKQGEPNPDFTYRATGIMDDVRVIALYNEIIGQDIPPAERKGNWVDEYSGIEDILKCLETQFMDRKRIEQIVRELRGYDNETT